MIWRFSLYGFLKNQRYYDPFLILAFREKGLSFFLIGILIAFREITVNIFEIPSGAVADIYGRRRSMILSFCSYIASFAIFGLSRDVEFLFLAMFFFAIGDAFRTGTHKAMIFRWLQIQRRSDERTRVYGFTRSWSKLGSALSVVLAAIFVFVSDSYVYIFYFSIIPYLLAIINFLGYPVELDGERKEVVSLGAVVRHLKEALSASFRRPGLRRLILESMGFEGVFKATKDYLQPVLKSAAVLMIPAVVIATGLNEPQRAALLVGPVYFLLYILSALASRHAHRMVNLAGSEQRCARMIWGLNLLAFAALVPAMYFELYPVMIAGFVVLFVLQNFWRPVLISRFDAHSSEAQKATVLSIESQAKSVSTMVIAPILGLTVDLVAAHNLGGRFWPVGALGAVIALLFFATAPSHERPRLEDITTEARRRS